MKHIFASLLCLIAFTATASDVAIVDVTATESGGLWRFDVTLRHDDTGWDHYADGWKVTLLTGEELGLRILAHPHVNEQPFTRSLGNVEIPAGTKRVLVHAKDNLNDWDPAVFVVILEQN